MIDREPGSRYRPRSGERATDPTPGLGGGSAGTAPSAFVLHAHLVADGKDPGPWEGEQRNMWKPSQQEALWVHGGNLHQSRHYSLYLALQLKARYEEIPMPVHRLQEVHHLR